MGVCASAPAEGSLAAGKVQKVGVPRHGRDESYGGGSVRRGPEEETVRGGKQWYQVVAAQRKQLEASGASFSRPKVHSVWESSVRNTRGSKPNQDATCAAAMEGHRTVVGVFDGHGPHGEQVSGMLSRALLAAVLDTAARSVHPDCDELSDLDVGSSMHSQPDSNDEFSNDLANGHGERECDSPPLLNLVPSPLSGHAAITETPLRGPYQQIACTLKHSRSYEVLSGLDKLHLEEMEQDGSVRAGSSTRHALSRQQSAESKLPEESNGVVLPEEGSDDSDADSCLSSMHSVMIESAEPGPLDEKALASAFVAVDDMLCTAERGSEEAAMVELSGSTAIMAIVGQEYIVVACTGDSRAVLGVRMPDAPPDQLVGVQVTVDHKPINDEAVRVRAAGGRVAPWPGEEHIQRVWSGRGAAVATSRAFGDAGWKQAGVVATPDVVRRRIESEDALLVLCSDGVSDALNNDAIVRAAAAALDAGKDPAEAVTHKAVDAWAEKFARRRRDDISALVVRLN
jgi:serine/threonine protein phosphatase PrpC